MKKQDEIGGDTAKTVAREVVSVAVDLVMALDHPSPQDGGPCATCAFRTGTDANTFDLTQTLVRLCVEGGRTFHCHEKKQLCRGYIGAVNIRGVPEGDKARIHGFMADWLAEEIAARAEGFDVETDTL